jgi:hypothetical protein
MSSLDVRASPPRRLPPTLPGVRRDAAPAEAHRRGLGAALGVLFVGPLLAGSVGWASPASAHPSDFETLTLDLLLGPSGLEGIDAAVVPGLTYEPFVATEVKRAVATEVLDALDLPASGDDIGDIDAELSERYHHAGFVVRFDEPAPGATAPLSIATADLQAIVDDRQLGRLKLSVCGVTEGAEPSEEVLARTDVRATETGRRPAGLEREACEVWVLEPADRPVAITITLPRSAAGGASEARRDSGSTGVSPWVPALTALVAGAALTAIVAVTAVRRQRRAS